MEKVRFWPYTFRFSIRAFILALFCADAATDVSIQINDLQSDEEIVSEKYGPVTIISLNRPKHKNAITNVMANKLTDAILTFETDENASVAILNGVGGNFSSGLDLDELRENVNDTGRFLGDDGVAV